MKPEKLNQLFEAARKHPAPAPSADFEGDVMGAVRSALPGSAEMSLWDELGFLFPRLAWVAAVLIVICVAADFGLASSGGPDLDEGLAQVSQHWDFTSEGM